MAVNRRGFVGTIAAGAAATTLAFPTATRADVITKRERYERLRTALRNDQASFVATWKDLADYFAPRRTRWWAGDKNRGDRRTEKIVNSTGRFAARTLQSGLHSGLTSPARPWMKLTTPDQSLAERPNVKTWLWAVSERMRALFAVSNTYNVLPVIYGDMGVFGTGAMSVLEDANDLFRCYSYPIGSYYLACDTRGKVNTFVRDYQLTVRQIVDRFVRGPHDTMDWSVVSVTVKDLWEKGDYQNPIDCCWVVEPNEDYRADRPQARYLKFASCHFEVGENRGVLLGESGFNEFPIMAPRWEVTSDDDYGTDCPGMMTLGDNKQLQQQEREKAKAIEKMVNPALVGPTALRNQQVSLLPGGVAYVDLREGMQGLKSIHDINLRIDHLTMDMLSVEKRIQRGFFEDLFLMLAQSDAYRGSQPLTAREVAERHEEKLLALGPVLEQTNDELLDPLVDRTFYLMLRAGLFPPPPPELEGVKLRVEYISILHEAQKLVGVVAIDRFLQSVLPLVELFPGIRAKVDEYQVVDNYGDMLGIDPRVIRPTDQAQQIVQQQQEQQAAAARAEQMATMAKAGKDASETQMGTDSALDRLTGAMTGAQG